MQDCFRTVLRTGNGLYEEKRSRFISWVYPVSTENEAICLMADLKKKYWDARHQCFAYIIEGEMTAQKYSDDGEPSGTAGLPILDAIKKRELINVLVVVIRYFGGVLLGASGLVRAYGKAAIAGLDDAKIIIRRKCLISAIHTEYPLLGKIQNFAAANNFPVKDIIYTDTVEMNIIVEPEKRGFFENTINDITGGNAKMAVKGTEYVDFDLKGNYIRLEY